MHKSWSKKQRSREIRILVTCIEGCASEATHVLLQLRLKIIQSLILQHISFSCAAVDKPHCLKLSPDTFAVPTLSWLQICFPIVVAFSYASTNRSWRLTSRYAKGASTN